MKGFQYDFSFRSTTCQERNRILCYFNPVVPSLISSHCPPIIISFEVAQNSTVSQHRCSQMIISLMAELARCQFSRAEWPFHRPTSTLKQRSTTVLIPEMFLNLL